MNGSLEVYNLMNNYYEKLHFFSAPLDEFNITLCEISLRIFTLYKYNIIFI